MDKVNQYLFYEFGASLRPLRNLESGQRLAFYTMPVLYARGALKKFLSESSHVPLKRSRLEAQKLYDILADFTPYGPGTGGLSSLKAPLVRRDPAKELTS